MAASRRWGSTFSPYSNSTCVVAAPYASHIWAQRSPNLPHEAATPVSPGRIRLATAASIAPVPEAAKQSTGLRVWKIRGRRSRQRA